MENNIGQTDLANSIEAANDELKYDTQVKSILANKHILAWILKYTTKEFHTYSIETIKECIENPRVACESILPGLTNVDKISGIQTENAVINEGKIYFDIRFNVFTPEQEKRDIEKMIVDVEAQNDYYPGYDLVTRGIFYNARQLSAQLETEFTLKANDRMKYNNIKKVYSVWCCFNSPLYMRNTIATYDIKPTLLYGDYSITARYDLMSVIVVCLDDRIMEEQANEDERHDFLRMMSVLLSNMEFEQKKRILEAYGIPMEDELGEEIFEMCNLSKGIKEDGIKIGMQQGMQQGIQQGITNLVETLLEMNQPKEVIIEKLMDKYGLLEPDAENYVLTSTLFATENNKS